MAPRLRVSLYVPAATVARRLPLVPLAPSKPPGTGRAKSLYSIQFDCAFGTPRRGASTGRAGRHLSDCCAYLPLDDVPREVSEFALRGRLPSLAHRASKSTVKECPVDCRKICTPLARS